MPDQSLIFRVKCYRARSHPGPRWFVAARKSHDADKLAADLLKAGKMKVPEYAFDCHTLKGKREGKTKADFFREEQRALKPFQPGLFDDLT